MTHFLSAAVASLILLADPSSSSNLRQVSELERRLSYETIAFYEPKSQVTDHNAIDLDQADMEDQLSIGSDVSFEKARRIYADGGHSKSVAVVKLTTPLTRGLSKYTAVSGQNANGVAVYGKLYENYPNGVSQIEIQYKTIDQQKSYVGCQVGGLPRPNLEGCLTASGTLTIDGGDVVNYTYEPASENINKRTLRKFSTTAEEKMFRCDNCPYDTFKKFREYYGHFDYADKWVDAAFDGSGTKFIRGNANFARYGFKGRTEAIQKSTAYMNIWMYVIREMEDALDDCKNDCKKTGCNDDTVRAWDEAVAFYTGSLEGSDGQGSGNLLYALADKRCKDFRTCGDLAKSTEGISHVNQEIFRDFTLASRMLAQAKCGEARAYKESIEQMMTVPLIQGTLRYAYITSTDKNAGEKAEAEGATFAAAVLPIVHACDEDQAEIIYKNMKTGQANRANFAQVKMAFESVYECMGVRGSDVGGLWNEVAGDYYVGASPFTVNPTIEVTKVNIPLIIGCTVGGLIAGIIVYIFVSKCCCTTGETPVETKEDPMSEEAEDAEATPSAISNAEDPLPSVDSQCEPVEIS